MKKLSIKEMRKKKKGFTLIELIIVIAILAILAALALPKFGAVKNTANISADKATAKNIQVTIAKLIAEDKIALPATAIADGTPLPSDVTAAIDGSITPKLKAFSHGTFGYGLSTTGDITITVKPGTGDSGTATLIYPTPAGVYAAS